MKNSIVLLHRLPGRMRVGIGKGLDRAALIESKCRRLPQVYAASYTEQTGTLLLYYNASIPGSRVMLWVKELFSDYKQTAGLSDYGENGPAALPSEIFRNILAIAVYAIEHLLAPGRQAGASVSRRLISPTVLALLFASKQIIRSGIESLLATRQVNAISLTAVAILAAAVKGKAGSALLIVTLSNFAEVLTGYTAKQTRSYITRMLKLDVPYVWRVEKDGNERRVHISAIVPGETIAVFIGEKISVDGSVTHGLGAVDESSLTGEFMPREVSKGNRVYAGSILKSGQIQVQAERVGDDTAITRMIKLIEQAQNRRAPIQSQADKMAQSLVPLSLAMAVTVYALTKDWSRVMNALFIDYACGLTLSTTTAISAAIGKAAKQGILIKGGQYIEWLAEVDTLVFDKTGTLTEGRPVIRNIYCFNKHTKAEVIRYAASAEEHSSHPFAGTILQYAREQNLSIPEHGKVLNILGRGIKAEVDGSTVLVGSDLLMRENGVDPGSRQTEELKAAAGETMIYVACNGELMGMISVHDPVRAGMNRTINQLRRQGVDEIILLTGDKKQIAGHISHKLLLDNYHAELLPEDKANLIKCYRQSGSRVMMVGDGINDAPALAYADVGVTLGGKRTDMAMEASDVIVIGDDPLQLPTLIKLAQQTMKTIRQNFLTTIIVNSIAMMLGAMGTITPVLAALIHNATTIGVVANSYKIIFVKLPGNGNAALRERR
jgi:cation-transporting P-type ATPase C